MASMAAVRPAGPADTNASTTRHDMGWHTTRWRSISRAHSPQSNAALISVAETSGLNAAESCSRSRARSRSRGSFIGATIAMLSDTDSWALHSAGGRFELLDQLGDGIDALPVREDGDRLGFARRRARSRNPFPGFV